MIPLLLLFLAGAAAAKPPAAEKPAPKPIQVRVPVSVHSEKRLKPADFKAAVEGASSAKIVRVRTPEDDLVLIVIMDVVGDLALVEPARQALVQQIGAMPKRIHVALLRAQDGLRVLLDPTADRNAFESALMSMPIAGKAGLLDTVQIAEQIGEAVARKSEVRVALLYITDSNVRNYQEDFTNPVINSSDSRDLSRRFPEGLIREKISRLETTLEYFQTPMSIVHLAYSSERLNNTYQTGLLQLARSTGGTASFCRSSAEISTAISSVLWHLTNQYHVHVQLPPKAPKSIVLSLTSGNRALTYRSRYPVR
jgi:hypothetical protein